MLDWIKDHQWLIWSSGASLALLVASTYIMPFVVARIRPDYFAHEQRPARRSINLAPAVRVAVYIGKNLLGTVLLIAGLVMLVLPGPGLLTTLIGFFLLDFPGKYRLERWLIARPAIHRPINWLRRRGGHVPLVIRPAATTLT